jgi:hypothetical protein
MQLTACGSRSSISTRWTVGGTEKTARHVVRRLCMHVAPSHITANQHWFLGMESDTWLTQLFEFVSAKILIWLFVSVSDC